MNSDDAAPKNEEPWWRRIPDRRTVDRLLAVACHPIVVLLTLAPGGLHDPGAGGAGAPEVAGLAYRLFPGALEERGYAQVLAIDHWVLGLAVLVVVPGVTCWAMLHRRARPEPLLAIAVVLLLLTSNVVPIAVALYTHAAWSRRRWWLAAWTVLALAAFVGSLWGASLSWSAATLFLAAFVTPLSLGWWSSARRQLVDSLRERAERLERERLLLAERAVSAERTRIAREMHDVVAHRVSLIVLHAGGIELSANDPELTRSAGQISDIGREALSELRAVLGVLHDSSHPDASSAPMAPQPTLADLDRLIAEWRAAGMPVRAHTTGSPRELPARLGRTAYRVVQEALTNAGKHAAGGPVRVSVDHRPAEVVITVVNDLVQRPAEGSPPEGGYGLAGLRERVGLAGGDLVVGPLPEGTWELRARLPVAPHGAVTANGTPEGGRPGTEEHG